MLDSIFSIECAEPEGTITRRVYPLVFSNENILKFWNQAKKFPSLYGKEIQDNPKYFTDMFMRVGSNGTYDLNGMFWVIDDFVGVFHVSDIQFDRSIPLDAKVHYTFFDKRHKGRENLVQRMLAYIFDTYQFQRLSAELPNYVQPHTRHFASTIGFVLEGKKRKAAWYKDEWFDVNTYGILRSELKHERGN